MGKHSAPKKKSVAKRIILGIIALLLISVVAFASKAYYDVNKSANTMYRDSGKVVDKRNGKKVSLDGESPFSILLMGTDTGEFGRSYKGRTDTMIYVTVNPKTKQTNMLSLARDSRVNISGINKIAKINAAYAYGGPTMAINTVQNFLDVPVDHYVLVNMKGLEKLVDSVGGVSVNNNLNFTFEGKHFPIGTIYLNGKDALSYSRMRHDDPQGDFGRQLRQQEIIKAVLKKAVSLNMVTHYNQFLNALQDNVQTDLKLNDILAVQGKYKDSLNDIKTSQLRGHGAMIDGQSFQVMNKNEINAKTKVLREQLDLN